MMVVKKKTVIACGCTYALQNYSRRHEGWLASDSVSPLQQRLNPMGTDYLEFEFVLEKRVEVAK
jgi:hypothetical protein